MWRRANWILLAPLAWLLTLAAARTPAITESVYAGTVYPLFATVLNWISGFISISLTEVSLFLLLIYIPVAVINVFRRHSGVLKALKKVILHTAVILSVTYFIFVVVWGLNYNRLPLHHISGLDVTVITTSELAALCLHLVEQANALRVNLPEDELGIMKLVDGAKGALKRAQLGYDEVGLVYPELSRSYGTPKGALLSSALSYMGIAGIYSPFTGEAHVNIKMPHSAIPATATHEIAHQHGFSREDEANFIGYLTCILHPDADFQYSGTLLALKYSMSALYPYDPHRYNELLQLYSPGVVRDLAYERAFWERYQGPVERVADRVNDAYLKANLQEDGVLSYGRMVDLLIAYKRQMNLNN